MLKIQQCCTYIPDKSKSLEVYIKNITHLREDLTELKVDGAWEKLSKGFSSVGNCFSTFSNSLLGKILMPIVAVATGILM